MPGARTRASRFWRSSALPFAQSRLASDSAACYAPHAHDELSLGAVDAGASVFCHEGQGRLLQRGDVVMIPAQAVHACNPQPGAHWSYQMLYLDEAWVQTLVGEMGALDAVVLPGLQSGALPGLYQRLTQLNRLLFAPSLSDEARETALLVFVAEVFGPARAHFAATTPRAGLQAGLARAMRLMQARCCESLGLAELAAEAGMSRYHFVRAFQRATGLTPHAWLLDQRVRRARRLLDQGVPFVSLALQLGFADQAHFQRVFKQRVAATPGEYRRNFLQD